MNTDRSDPSSGLAKLGSRFLRKVNWDTLFFAVFLVIAPFLLFHNLELNPRPWSDEGSYLTLAKTLAEDGVYAVHNSDGYQTFGAVQSLGPTLIVPIAWSFQKFGAGLIQGRVISAFYSLITLFLFYSSSHLLFGRRTALFSIVLLLGSPAVGFLLYGRPVLGEAAALGYFLASWMLWFMGFRAQKNWLYILSGLLLGGAMVTKNQYVLIGFASIGTMVLLDVFYYRVGGYKGLLIAGIVASCCVAAWYGWQILYFGGQLFKENASKLGALAAATTGFSFRSSMDAIRFLLGSGSGYTYVFWGFPALIYIGVLSSRRSRDAFQLAYLVVFVGLWLAFFVFLVIPWGRYIFAAAAILAMFVAKLFADLLDGFIRSMKDKRSDINEFVRGPSGLAPQSVMALGTLVALSSLTLWSVYQLQKVIRDDVLDKTGYEDISIYSPPQFQAPDEMAAYLSSSIPKDAIIETWERELGILTDHRYHYPDASLLASADQPIYRDGTGSNSQAFLGKDYFDSVHPDYVIVGWYARFNNIYDAEYLAQNAMLVRSFGDGPWRYDLYKMKYP